MNVAPSGRDRQTDKETERERHQLAVQQQQQRLLWRVFKMLVLAINCSFDFANLVSLCPDCSAPSGCLSLSLSVPSIIMMRLSTAAGTSSQAGIAQRAACSVERAAECGSRTKCDLLAKPNNKLQKQLIGFNVHLVCDWL